ncbi:uncharacterized protein LOC144700110 [Wolffia australiana]
MEAVCGRVVAPTWRRSPPPAVAAAAAALRRRPRSFRRSSIVASSQFNAAKVLRTAWKVARDGVEGGAKLIPESVPRPVARVAVAAAAAAVALFLLKSLVSTVLFVAAMMGLIYFGYMAFNAKDEGTSDGNVEGKGDDETLEEARRIMEKYK